MPTVSIAMTTYNGEKYLREQLDSILNQTCKDFELIICDDCSSDSSVHILNEYAGKDKRIKVFVNEHNLGFKKNFEKAISLCNRDYIALSDQDDVWKKEHIEILLSNLGDSYLVCGNVELIDSNGSHIKNDQININRYISKNCEEQFLQLLHINFVQGCTCLFRKELVSKILPIPENQKYHDKWIGLVAILEQKPIIYVDKTLVYYRRHDKNVTVKSDSLRDKLKWNEDIKDCLSTQTQVDIYNAVFDYFSRFLEKKFSFKDVGYFFKNYNLIYQKKSILKFIPRFIKRFILFI